MEKKKKKKKKAVQTSLSLRTYTCNPQFLIRFPESRLMDKSSTHTLNTDPLPFPIPCRYSASPLPFRLPCSAVFFLLLLLPKADGVLDCDGEFRCEGRVVFVLGEIEAVEAFTMSAGPLCQNNWTARAIRMTYQVCDFGKASTAPVVFSIVNLRGPSLPCRSLKPLTGIRDVPVANCRRRDFCSGSQPRMHCHCL